MGNQAHLPLQAPHHPRGQAHSIVPRQLPWGKSPRYSMFFRRPHQIASFHPKSRMDYHFHLRQVYLWVNAMMDLANCLPGSAEPVRNFPPFLIDDPDLSKFLSGATPEFRRLLSRSSPRPSLASVNVLLLHPATLRPVSEGRTSTHSSRSTAGSHVADPGDTDSLSAALPSSLPSTCPQDISQLPSFPETATNPSAATSSGFPSSSSPPSSPDFLDGIILAEESRRTRREYSLLSVSH